MRRTCGDCHACQTPLKLGGVEARFNWKPRHLVLETTNQCNLDCIMCERRLNKPDNLMGRETFDLAMGKLAPGFVAIELSGLGEPTLAPDFVYQVGKVQDLNRILYFPTNGTGLRGNKLDQLRDDDRTRVNFSMDAAKEETYGQIRVDKAGKAASFSDLLNSVRGFRKSKPGARLITSFTAASYNIDEFPEFVELAANLGANQVAFKPARCWALPPEKYSLRYLKDRSEAALAGAIDNAIRLGVQLVAERPYYSHGFENAGEIPGFINYLDILPLELLECGGATATGESVTTPGTLTSSLTTAAVGEIEIINYGVLDSGDLLPQFSDNVMLVTTEGIICTCAARHPIGDVVKDDYASVMADPKYRQHLAARAEGRALDSPWCRGCEKMM